MKKIYLFLLVIFGHTAFAQQKGISYQAVIINPNAVTAAGYNGTSIPLANKPICLLFQIVNSTNQVEYQESQSITTNVYGMVNVVIGTGNTGTGLVATLDAVNWNQGAKKLVVSVNTEGICSNYTEISNQLLNYTPYSLYAQNADIKDGYVTDVKVAMGINPNKVGLGNVNNTSDANKPVSIATQTALNLKANTADVTTSLALKEDVSNKSNAILGTSTTLYPTQNAVKTYVDRAITAATIVDADTATKGKIKLAGDLAGTADLPTVPGLALKANTANVTTSLALKEDVSNKSNAILGTSTTLYPTQNAVKTYVDAQVASATIADATSSIKGKILLGGDLGGTADLPTVPGLALKADIASPTFTGAVTATIYASTPQSLTAGATINWNPANGLNASVTLDQNSTLSFTATPTAGSYGTVVVSQDATGGRTITLPSTANKILGSTSTTTIALSSAANAKDILNFYYDGTNCYWNIGQGYGTVATSATTNLATSVSGTLPVANGGTGATTLTGLVKGNGTGAMTAATVGTDYQAPINLTTSGTGAATLIGTTLNIPAVSSTVDASTITGTVAVANGGTGVTTSTGSGNVVLSTSPTLITPALGTPSALVLTNATGLPLTSAVTGTLSVTNGGTGLSATPANGQIDIGNGTGFTRATLTAGTAITITNTSGVITIAAAIRPTADQFTATAAQASFTLTQTPITNTTISPNVKPNVRMYINGIRTNNLAYSVSGTTVTYTAANNNSYALVVGDRIQFDYAY